MGGGGEVALMRLTDLLCAMVSAGMPFVKYLFLCILFCWWTFEYVGVILKLR